jgi:hypothetical protein
MYHPKVINGRLEEYCRGGHAKLELTERQRTQGCSAAWEPQYHSPTEVQTANAHFAALLDEEGNLKPDEYGRKREFSIEEARWIANERLLCRLDYLYWATRYAYIKHVNTGQMSLFEPNVAQRIFQRIRAEHDLKEMAIELLDLKARQLGDSTDKELCLCHRVTFWPYTNAVVASSDCDKSDKMSRMMERIWSMLPYWMIPRKGVWVSAKGGAGRFEFPDQHCSVSIQHGAQFTGISRGDTVDAYHISETSNFINPQELIDAALMNAVHPNRWTLGAQESTAFMKNDWFHRQWMWAKDNWPRGRSRLRPTFLPWFIGTDLWPTPTWIHDHPIPKDYEIPDFIVRHAERARAYVRSNDLLRSILGADWKMPLHQMWYYDCAYMEAKQKDTLQKFLAEMPADDVEAFTARNVSVFNHDTITFYQDNRKHPEQTGGGVYGLIGSTEELPQRLQPSYRDYNPNKPPIDIHCRWGTGGTRFTLQPLRYQGMVDEPADGLGRIYVWYPPEDGFTYGFGIDTADGVGRDRTVIQGLRKADLRAGVKDTQMLEFASDYINAFDLWPYALALGTWYSGRSATGLRMQPKMAIECKGNGETAQLELKKRGWTNLHRWTRYDGKKIDKGKAHKLGIVTNSWFRPMMLDMLIKWIRDGWIEINSPYFIQEMETLERDWDRQDTRALDGCFDDRIMALGFILISEYDTEIRGAHAHTNDGHAMSRVYASRGAPMQQGESPYAYFSGMKIPVLGEETNSPARDFYRQGLRIG